MFIYISINNCINDGMIETIDFNQIHLTKSVIMTGISFKINQNQYL